MVPTGAHSNSVASALAAPQPETCNQQAQSRKQPALPAGETYQIDFAPPPGLESERIESNPETRYGLVLRVATIIAFANLVRAFSVWFPWSLNHNIDAGWLIRTGDYIFAHGIPTTDPFSWSHPQQSFVAYQWLFECALSALHKLGGMWCVDLAGALVSGTLLLIVMPLIWWKRKIHLALSFLFLAMVPSAHWFYVRPQLLSFFFILATIAILERWRIQPKQRLICALPALFALWANIHTFWMIGLLLIALYVVCAALRRSASPKDLGMLLVVAMASAVALLINPYGPELISYAFTFLDSSQYLNIQELWPMYKGAQYFWPITFLTLSLAAIIHSRRRVPSEGLIASFVSFVVAFHCSRYEPVAVLINWWYLGMALEGTRFSAEQLRTGIDRSLSMRFGVAAYAVACLVASVACYSFWIGREDVAESHYLLGSGPLLRFAKRHITVDSSMIVDPETGSQIVYLTGSKVFLDTRFDMYPKSFVYEWEHFATNSSLVRETIERRNIQYLLVRNNCHVLQGTLLRLPEWTLAADDGRLSLWIKGPGAGTRLSRWLEEDKRNHRQLEIASSIERASSRQRQSPGELAGEAPTKSKTE